MKDREITQMEKLIVNETEYEMDLSIAVLVNIWGF